MSRARCVGLLVLASMGGAATAAEDGMVLIPAGPFIMGSNKTDKTAKTQEYGMGKPLYLDEHPQHSVNLPDFYLDLYEVTNAQYRDFVIQTNNLVPNAWSTNGYLLTPELLGMASLAKLRQLAAKTFRLDKDTTQMDKAALFADIAAKQQAYGPLPVTGVTWHNAHEYCQWRGKHLPREAEWEKAARGPQGLEYPWGNTWDPAKLNASGADNWTEGTAPVGAYPAGKSPYGVFDMAGNVMEWVADDYHPYPGATYTNKAFGVANKVVRGGGWGGMGHYAISQFYRGAYRFFLPPDAAYVDLGFRCAKDATREQNPAKM